MNGKKLVIALLIAIIIIGAVTKALTDKVVKEEAEQAAPQIEPFATEDFNGLIVDAYDVNFAKNEDTGKYIVEVAVRLENTNETSFKLSTPFISNYKLGGLPDKLTGGEIVEGTITRQTQAKAPSTIENRTVTLSAYDMAEEQTAYVNLVVPDEYFEDKE